MPSLLGSEIKLALPDYMITILVHCDLVLYLVGVFNPTKPYTQLYQWILEHIMRHLIIRDMALFFWNPGAFQYRYVIEYFFIQSVFVLPYFTMYNAHLCW